MPTPEIKGRPLRKFGSVALDWERVYAVRLSSRTEKAFGGKQIPQVSVYMDLPPKPVEDCFTVKYEDTAKRIWEAVNQDPRFFVVKDQVAIDRSKIVKVELQPDGSGDVVVLLPSNRSGTLKLPQEIVPEIAKKILDSLT